MIGLWALFSPESFRGFNVLTSARQNSLRASWPLRPLFSQIMLVLN